MYRNILVAIDGSPSSLRALEHAIGLADRLNAQLLILGVVPPPPSAAYAAGFSPDRLEAEASEMIEQALRAAVEQAGELPVHTRQRHGDPAREIVAQAVEGDHDLVVVGSRGRGRLASTILGTVAGDVHFHLHVPLLVVHGHGHGQP